MIRHYSACAILLLSACVGPTGRPRAQAGAAPFDPIGFFAGHTQGEGRLKVAMARGRAVHVSGNGTVERDGSLTLTQRVEQDGQPARTRRWSLRPAGAGAFAGELTDATGPVSATRDGGVLHIRFSARHGLQVEQWLALQPDARTVRNRLIVRKLGVAVAVLDETIRKID